jgi:hypothetical protein
MMFATNSVDAGSVSVHCLATTKCCLSSEFGNPSGDTAVSLADVHVAILAG